MMTTNGSQPVCTRATLAVLSGSGGYMIVQDAMGLGPAGTEELHDRPTGHDE